MRVTLAAGAHEGPAAFFFPAVIMLERTQIFATATSRRKENGQTSGAFLQAVFLDQAVDVALRNAERA